MTGHAFESRILSMATLVAADGIEARQWYRSDPIATLDGRTAHELVQAGDGLAVLDFLLGVLRYEMPGARLVPCHQLVFPSPAKREKVARSAG